ncbi:hypothetical protein BpHYR1_046317 [Brachionus plicatilis]|uniref:Uncharacterized protein n=1 Tax=Brachionus plicatilis TaxID=10195 RepID=A0A3M7SFR4_BRAPC|nr:hypothetical protein BpHYR1_046317 [Brachionus plicatilis]
MIFAIYFLSILENIIWFLRFGSFSFLTLFITRGKKQLDYASCKRNQKLEFTKMPFLNSRIKD